LLFPEPFRPTETKKSQRHVLIVPIKNKITNNIVGGMKWFYNSLFPVAFESLYNNLFDIHFTESDSLGAEFKLHTLISSIFNDLLIEVFDGLLQQKLITEVSTDCQQPLPNNASPRRT